MANVFFKCLTPSVAIANGERHDSTVNSRAGNCAEFIKVYPKNMINGEPEKRFFEIYIDELSVSLPVDRKKMIMWWYNVLSTNLNLKYLNVIGIEDNQIILELKTPVIEESLRTNSMTMALLEFSLFRYSWGDPLSHIIYFLYKSSKLIEASKYDYLEFLLVYNYIIRNGIDECEYFEDDIEEWENYFDINHSSPGKNDFNLIKFKELNKVINNVRSDFRFFSIWNLFRDPFSYGVSELMNIPSAEMWNFSEITNYDNLEYLDNDVANHLFNNVLDFLNRYEYKKRQD